MADYNVNFSEQQAIGIAAFVHITQWKTDVWVYLSAQRLLQEGPMTTCLPWIVPSKNNDGSKVTIYEAIKCICRIYRLGMKWYPSCPKIRL